MPVALPASPMPSPVTRRSLLLGLLALAGCPRLPEVSGPGLTSGAVLLGWRLVPGQQLVYRTVVQRTRQGIVTRRAEEWTYRVEALEPGAATLLGHLTAIGAGVDHPEVEDDAEAFEAQVHEALLEARGRAEVTLALNGRLTACSARGFADALRHHALGVLLPSEPVTPHESWPDTTSLRLLQDLLPLEVSTETRGESRLLELGYEGRDLVASLASEAELRAPGLATLTARGRARWDLTAGSLLSRELTLEGDLEGPGRLDLSLERVG